MTAVRISGILGWLLVLWLLLWDDLSIANVVSGLLVGAAVLAFARLPRVKRADDENVARVNVLRSIGFGFYVLYKLVEANFILAWEIVTPRNTNNTGVIAVFDSVRSGTATTPVLIVLRGVTISHARTKFASTSL